MWGSDGMMGYGHGWGMGWSMLFGGIFWIVLLILGFAAVVWIVRALSHRDGDLPPIDRGSSALRILEERYARGEIQREEYLEKKRDLGG